MVVLSEITFIEGSGEEVTGQLLGFSTERFQERVSGDVLTKLLKCGLNNTAQRNGSWWPEVHHSAKSFCFVVGFERVAWDSFIWRDRWKKIICSLLRNLGKKLQAASLRENTWAPFSVGNLARDLAQQTFLRERCFNSLGKRKTVGGKQFLSMLF